MVEVRVLGEAADLESLPFVPYALTLRLIAHVHFHLSDWLSFLLSLMEAHSSSSS